MTCVNEASNEIHRLCPYNKGAIIWYDNCLVKYLNKDFFGEIDNQNKFYMNNLRNVSEATTLNAKTRELLSLLAKEASVTPKLYADCSWRARAWRIKEALWFDPMHKRDLSNSDCFKCLDGAIGELPRCCNGKGGRVDVGRSCNIRYEIYPFVSHNSISLYTYRPP